MASMGALAFVALPIANAAQAAVRAIPGEGQSWNDYGNRFVADMNLFSLFGSKMPMKTVKDDAGNESSVPDYSDFAGSLTGALLTEGIAGVAGYGAYRVGKGLVNHYNKQYNLKLATANNPLQSLSIMNGSGSGNSMAMAMVLSQALMNRNTSTPVNTVTDAQLQALLK